MRTHAAEPTSATSSRTPERGGAVSPTFVHERFLDPAMEATAHNLDQFNPSPEIDSIFEHMEVLLAEQRQQLADDDHEGLAGSIDRMASFVREAKISNLSEGSQTKAISGDADKLLTRLRDQEANGIREQLGPKAIARKLRGPIKVLMSPDGRDARTITEAREIYREVRATHSPDQLVNSRVEHELGGRQFAFLKGLVNA